VTELVAATIAIEHDPEPSRRGGEIASSGTRLAVAQAS
jgi:hypothetical protein